MPVQNRIRIILFLPLLLASFQFSHANTFGDIDVGYTSDDNLTRSDYGPDKRASGYIDIYADYGKFFDHADNWSSSVLGFVQHRTYPSYSSLASTGLGVSGSVSKKLGLGAYASSITVDLSISQNNVTDTKRSNTLIEGGIGWGKRVTDDWDLSAGVSMDNTNARNNVFDTSGTTYYFSADYTLNQSFLLNMGLSVRQGHIITITSPSTNPNYYNINKGSYGNKVTDTVYGTGLVAHRVKSTTTIYQLGLSYAIDDFSSANIGYERQESKLSYGVTYSNNLIRANYIYSF